ncbi:MAG: (Fe-S)-binding protein, partial [Chitinophagia bacterium]|nr:(Fe-S)-binding protein [Chitinophagia bacterium]
TTRINFERAEQALETGATVIAANCPFCTTMLTDGIKNKEKEDSVKVMDIAEMVAQSLA